MEWGFLGMGLPLKRTSSEQVFFLTELPQNRFSFGMLLRTRILEGSLLQKKILTSYSCARLSYQKSVKSENNDVSTLGPSGYGIKSEVNSSFKCGEDLKLSFLGADFNWHCESF